MIDFVRNRKGITLIEILVSMAVLSIAVLSLTGMFSFSAARVWDAYGNTAALTVARDIMDRIKSGDINPSNLEDVVSDYENLHNMSIRVDITGEDEHGSLWKVKIYVACRPGMDPERDGVFLASYYFLKNP